MSYHDNPTGGAVAEPLPLKDAAARMGISVSALRGRLKRGTIESEKDSEGRILVYLPSADASPQGDKTTVAPKPQDDITSPLSQLIEAIQCLHTDLANHDAGLDRLMMMHREQFETNSGLESRIQDMARQIDTLHTAVKTMGAAFRVHAQETDRLIKALGRTVGGSAPPAAQTTPAFTPPTQKQRLFGRRQSDQDDAPSDVSSS